MQAFVDFTWRIRYLIWVLVAASVIHICYTLWNGTNFFLRQSQDFWSGFVFGAAFVAMLYAIRVTVPRRRKSE